MKHKQHISNLDSSGFGHICVSVDDLDAACKRFEEKGVSWKKRLTDGRMKNVAFVLDPDGKPLPKHVSSEHALIRHSQATGLRLSRMRSTRRRLETTRGKQDTLASA